MRKSNFLLFSFFVFFTSKVFSQEQNFNNYSQDISGSNLVIEMVAIPGGTFVMGSPEDEKDRYEDEGLRCMR
ncbi:hypothetical protein LZ575_16515 [Antarcticibacterium sp. 1MA-6-2]|uniref:hypothetical protein n=1 Tax=Antarcticibacterium sp. 1MA-6-2 TaxID=2908210 RepID=UPI001F3444C0|nr:hypothetical protein [Antarcticibacterium sp. 1MA-6-2]UJH90418.1 hypothetical protein LZ575_16515 [Antarcticibacterium sp. 1MA-6-2]